MPHRLLHLPATFPAISGSQNEYGFPASGDKVTELFCYLLFAIGLKGR